MSKEIPILFSSPMVLAILDGRKSQTRRIVKTRHSGLRGDGKLHIETAEAKEWVLSAGTDPQWAAFNGNTMATGWRKCPYGKPGDILWVRETWAEYFGGSTSHRVVPIYKASENIEWFKWKPSIHMKKKYARIWLEVINIRVERVQSISNEDAIAEGIETIYPKGLFGQGYERPDRALAQSASSCYEHLWVQINGDESWKNNNWVWVVEFKVLSTTGNETQKTWNSDNNLSPSRNQKG